MAKTSLYLVIVYLILSFTFEARGESGFPDTLYLSRLEVKSDRVVGAHRPIPPGGTLFWADIKGPAIIRHIWMTNSAGETEEAISTGEVTIRFYWDGHKEPDLEVPLNEFFGNKFSNEEEISWRMRLGKNVNYTMPFRKSARIELKNNSKEKLEGVYWHIDYEQVPKLPQEAKYFDINTRVAGPVSLDTTVKANKYIKGGNYIKAKESLLVAKLEGPAVIRRIQVSHNEEGEGEILANRGVIIRVFWEGEKEPSVEVPLGDFFGTGFGEGRNFTSQAWRQKDGRKEIFFPMPFKQSARIELVNLTDKTLGKFSWQIDYEKGVGLPQEIEYFHASFRISRPVSLNSTHVATETKGRGKFVGLVWSVHWINWETSPEGTQNFWIDGEHIKATGAEDYFGQAWGFARDMVHAYMGNSFGPEKSRGQGVGDWLKVTAYRAHILDPIYFQESFKLDFTNYGWNLGYRTDEYSTTGFWYQSEPHTPFLALPPAEDLYPIDFPKSLAFGMWRIYNLEYDYKYPEAIKKIEELLKTYPGNPKAADLLFKKGYLLEEQAKIDEALLVYQEVKRRFPDSEAAGDAQDKIWLLSKPGRMLLKMASPSGWEAYLDGKRITLEASIFRTIPGWGFDKIYRSIQPPLNVAWNTPASLIMRLSTIRLEPGSGEHLLAVKARAIRDKPISGHKLGYLFAALDVAGPDIMTDGSWKLSDKEVEGWETVGFNDKGWSQAVVHPLEKYADGSWTWLWPRGFRNFPSRMERIWGEDIEIHKNEKFRQNLLFRLFRKRINIPASFKSLKPLSPSL